VREAPSIAVLLRLNSGQVKIPGLELSPEGIWMLKTFGQILNEIYDELKVRTEAMGVSA